MKEFKEFRMGDLFEFKAIKQAKSQSEIPEKSDGVAYIVQSTVNNMWKMNADKDWLITHNEAPVAGNALVLGVTLPAVSYQPYEFGASQVITARADFLNESIGLYFVAILNKHMKKFSYQKKPGMKIYKDLMLSLPVTSEGEPDFTYMQERIAELEQERIAELEQERIAELEQYLIAAGLDNCELTDEDRAVLAEKKEYQEFKLGGDAGLFNIIKGKRLTKANMIQGNTPFVGASNTNNGITAYIGNTENYHTGGKFTVAYNGAVGASFYQDDGFIASDDVNIFDNPNISRNCCLYIMAQTRIIGSSYDWSNKWDKDAMEKTFILLPISSDGSIDFDYMERYIKAIEKIVIKGAVEEKDRIISETKKIVNS